MLELGGQVFLEMCTGYWQVPLGRDLVAHVL